MNRLPNVLQESNTNNSIFVNLLGSLLVRSGHFERGHRRQLRCFRVGAGRHEDKRTHCSL